MMKLSERFGFLLEQYVEGNISSNEKNDFFEMVASGDFDDIIEAHYEKSYYRQEADLANEIPPGNPYDMINSIRENEKKNSGLPKTKHLAYLTWGSVAAVFAVAICLFFINNSNRPHNFLAAFKTNSTHRISNTAKSPLPLLLPDGSRIILQPQSSICYSDGLFSNKREVCMEGEAMFNITKNPQKPFYVYYHDVVTKVLGTTFFIRTNHRSGKIEVEVLTGRVQVYENDKMLSNVKKDAVVTVTPNQKAVYHGDTRVLEATLVDKPLLISSHAELPDEAKKNDAGNHLSFENTRLAVVLKTIGQNYGIEITVSNDRIYNCAFTGELSNEDLYNQLKIICLATGSSYEINGTSILITGTGCK